ncbi:hypothetical protein SDC9_162564 [bioreactor metagenome]|uniref:N-acetyltransferase domain-containing protein n=1 Tax=bioreactor metagenome TaxID=1076179 RepID=A0A645FSS9_9ZZZZ
MRKREKVEIMIREAIPADAKDIIAFSKKTGAETPYLAYGAEGLELSEAFEELYLEDLMEKDNNVMLIATINNKQLIGLASVGQRINPNLDMSVKSALRSRRSIGDSESDRSLWKKSRLGQSRAA